MEEEKEYALLRDLLCKYIQQALDNKTETRRQSFELCFLVSRLFKIMLGLNVAFGGLDD